MSLITKRKVPKFKVYLHRNINNLNEIIFFFVLWPFKNTSPPSPVCYFWFFFQGGGGKIDLLQLWEYCCSYSLLLTKNVFVFVFLFFLLHIRNPSPHPHILTSMLPFISKLASAFNESKSSVSSILLLFAFLCFDNLLKFQIFLSVFLSL